MQKRKSNNKNVKFLTIKKLPYIFYLPWFKNKVIICNLYTLLIYYNIDKYILTINKTMYKTEFYDNNKIVHVRISIIY